MVFALATYVLLALQLDHMRTGGAAYSRNGMHFVHLGQGRHNAPRLLPLDPTTTYPASGQNSFCSGDLAGFGRRQVGGSPSKVFERALTCCPSSAKAARVP